MTRIQTQPVHTAEVCTEAPEEPLAATGHTLVTFAMAGAGDFEALVSIRIDAMRESLERMGRFDPVRARERFREGFSPNSLAILWLPASEWVLSWSNRARTDCYSITFTSRRAHKGQE